MKPQLERACACTLLYFWHGCPWSAEGSFGEKLGPLWSWPSPVGLAAGASREGAGAESQLDVVSFQEGPAVVSSQKLDQGGIKAHKAREGTRMSTVTQTRAGNEVALIKR